MRNSVSFFLPFALLLTAPGAFAEDLEPPAPSTSATPVSAGDGPEASAASPPTSEGATDSAPPATATAAEAAPPAPPSPPVAPPLASQESLLRPTLSHFASAARLDRYAESALGFTGAGALFGVGFAAEAPDMTWSHALWVASGITALGSLANLFVPSEIEALERQARTLSDSELERRWAELAQKAKVMRRAGAVFGGLVGAASITLGVLAFEGELGTLTDDQRRAVGSVLVAGGAIGVTQSAVEWFVPTPVERGFALAGGRRRVALSGAPSPSGFYLSVTGAF